MVGHRLRVLTRHDFKQRLTLLAVRSLVNEGLTLAAALVYRTRPLKTPAHAKPIEFYCAIVTVRVNLYIRRRPRKNSGVGKALNWHGRPYDAIASGKISVHQP